MKKLMNFKLNAIFSQYRIALLISTAFVSHFSSGFVNCTNLRNTFKSKITQNVSIIGKTDNRYAIPVFAKQVGKTELAVREEFIATVRIHCDNRVATANIVLKDNVIVTGAHIFYKDAESGKCNPILRKNKKCFIAPIISESEEGPQYQLDLPTLKVGTKCPNNAERSLDWAVVKLKKRVLPVTIGNKKIKIVPYPLYNDSINMLAHKPFLQVAADGLAEDKSIANICQGIIQNVVVETGARALATDCSNKPGNTGAANLVSEKNEVTGQIENQFAGLVANGTGSEHDFQPYSADNFTIGPSLDTAFRKAIMDAASK
jgi:hypothetical protein